MWQKFKEQIPVLVITVALVVGSVAYFSDNMTNRQRADLAPLRDQNDALRAQAEENRRQLEATTQLLKQAIAKSEGLLFQPETEIQKLNDQRVTLLADEIAKKIQPAFPAPKTAEEIAQLQNEQVDRVADRLTANLRPMLAGVDNHPQESVAEVSRQYQERVATLDQNLQATQAAAQDALALTHEVSALYLDSFKDQGVLVRLLSLPANLLIDTAKLNLVGSRDRTKAQEELAAKMHELETRLADVRGGTAVNGKK